MDTPVAKNRILIITPVRNEEKYLNKTIESMLSQRLKPSRWVIVDDGSTDNTALIAESIAQKYPWITVHKQTDRGYRDVGCGNVEAFYSGLSQVQIEDFDFIGKIDGDVVIKSSYLEKLIQLFRNDPLLGIASGWIKKERAQPFAPLDPAKLYRTSCFKEIGKIVNSPGHEIIDIYNAIRNGWKTQVFLDDSIEIIHLRGMGSSQNGFLHGRFRDGQACYYANCHPLYFLGRVVKHIIHYPYVIGGAATMWGYIRSWIVRNPRYGDEDFRKFVHRFQISQLSKAIINLDLKSLLSKLAAIF